MAKREALAKEFEDPKSHWASMADPLAGVSKDADKTAEMILKGEATNVSIILCPKGKASEKLAEPLAAPVLSKYMIANDEKEGAVIFASGDMPSDLGPDAGVENHTIYLPLTKEVLKVANKSFADAKCCFHVTACCPPGKDYDEMHAEYDAMAEQFGKMFGDLDGCICKIIKRNNETKHTAGTYFFNSAETLKAYLQSEMWAGFISQMYMMPEYKQETFQVQGGGLVRMIAGRTTPKWSHAIHRECDQLMLLQKILIY